MRTFRVDCDSRDGSSGENYFSISPVKNGSVYEVEFDQCSTTYQPSCYVYDNEVDKV